MKKLILLSLLAPSLALAQGKEAPAGPPPPAEELSVEKWFLGNWTCEVNQHASPMGPEMKTTSKVEFKMELGGYWMHFAVEQIKPKKMPVTAGYAGWDATTKKHIRGDVMPGGGSATLTTPGWDGDKLVFDGKMSAMGKSMPLRHTLTKKGDNEMSTIMEVGGPDGKMMTLFEETCKRGKK